MSGQTLPEKAYSEKWSIDEIAKEMLRNGPNSPEHKMFSSLLLMRQQQKVIDQTKGMVFATWVLVFASWALVIVDLVKTN